MLKQLFSILVFSFPIVIYLERIYESKVTSLQQYLIKTVIILNPFNNGLNIEEQPISSYF